MKVVDSLALWKSIEITAFVTVRKFFVDQLCIVQWLMSITNVVHEETHGN
jgi:hypothetical protein